MCVASPGAQENRQGKAWNGWNPLQLRNFIKVRVNGRGQVKGFGYASHVREGHQGEACVQICRLEISLAEVRREEAVEKAGLDRCQVLERHDNKRLGALLVLQNGECGSLNHSCTHQQSASHLNASQHCLTLLRYPLNDRLTYTCQIRRNKHG